MAIVTYQKSNRTKLTKNFAIYEFACKCGNCTTVKIDTELVAILQKVRDHFGKPVYINSGYRCAAHNKAVGGATNSNHTKGMAADIRVEGVAPIEVAKFLESIGVKGIGLYDNFVHVDTRTSKFFWFGHEQSPRSTFGGKVESKPANEVPKINYTQKDFVKEIQKIFGLTVTGVADQKLLDKTVTVSRRKNYKHAVVRPIQKYLYSIGYVDIANINDPDNLFDGIAGAKFDNAVKAYQKKEVHSGNLQNVDGEITAGRKTWKKLLGMK